MAGEGHTRVQLLSSLGHCMPILASPSRAHDTTPTEDSQRSSITTAAWRYSSIDCTNQQWTSKDMPNVDWLTLRSITTVCGDI